MVDQLLQHLLEVNSENILMKDSAFQETCIRHLRCLEKIVAIKIRGLDGILF